MKSIKYFATFALVLTAAFALNSYASNSKIHSEVTTGSHVHTSMQGKHCNGTVGCSCPGFSPITDGDVWQQAYCRHCDHKRSVHK